MYNRSTHASFRDGVEVLRAGIGNGNRKNILITEPSLLGLTSATEESTIILSIVNLNSVIIVYEGSLIISPPDGAF